MSNRLGNEQQKPKALEPQTGSPRTAKRVLTEHEAADYLGMSRSFLAQGRMNGTRRNRGVPPPYVKTGKRIGYLIEDLNQWLEKHRVVPS